MEAEIGVMLPQTKECQRLPSRHQKFEEKHGTDYPSELPERINPSNILIWNFQSPEL